MCEKTGIEGKEATEKKSIDFIDMWGDKVVGKPMNIYPQPPEHIVSSKPVRLWGEYYLHPDGKVYWARGDQQRKVTLAGRGSVKHFFHGKRKITFNIREELAKAFIPNPAGLPYVRMRDRNVYRVENLTWSSFRTTKELQDKALEVEKARGRYPEIFNPAIEIPVTITLFSRV